MLYTQINTLTFLCPLKMHSGQRKPLQLPQDEQFHHFSSELNGKNWFKMIRINSSFLCQKLLKKFATVDYEAHIKTNNDYSIK